MPDESFPRILVLSANPFSRTSGNGLIMSSLFQGWPFANLAQVYVPFVTRLEPMFDVCRRYWVVRPFGVREGPAAGEGPAPDARSAEEPGLLRRAVLRVAEVPFGRRLAQPVRELLYARPGLIGRAVLRDLASFAPDAVYSPLGAVYLQRIVLALGRGLGVPIIPHFTDDWITTEYRRVPGGRWLRTALERDFRAILEKAPARLVASEAMAEEYAVRYGGTFHTFTRCVESDRFRATPLAPRAGELIELVYAGQLSLGRWQNLRAIGEELRALSHEGIRARLTVYTIPSHVEHYRNALTLEPELRMAGSVANEALPDIYDAAHVLVHTESFDESVATYTRFSLSTKVTEYLMAGRPLFGFGPPFVSAMRYIAGSGAGRVAGAPHLLRETLRGLLRDPGDLPALGANARAFALAHHDGARERERFRRTLCDALVR